METFNHNHFKKMSWKNGGGETLELFRIPKESASGFGFRLSCAQVESNGPFSIFVGIDRSLLLLKGKGFNLTIDNKHKMIKEPLSPFHFAGEAPIDCQLIEGPCQDFNVMTDRDFGQSTISIICPSKEQVFTLTAECDFKFIYDIESQLLYKLGNGETFNLNLAINHAVIIVDLKIYA